MPKKNVLVLVLGQAPGIITEAIYYYAAKVYPAVQFAEIHVYTTTAGYQAVCKTLLGPKRGEDHYSRLMNALSRKALIDVTRTTTRFGTDSVHVLQGADQQNLEDVRTCEDSQAIADQLLEAIRKLHLEPDNQIYAVISGGRKTMGVQLACAMQLYGRAGDHVVHILVDPRIEEMIQRRELTAFYYPGDQPVKYKGRPLRPESIAIECDEIYLPYWPWPEQEPPVLKYRDLVENRIRHTELLRDRPGIKVDVGHRQVFIGGYKLDLSDLQFFYYAFFAERSKLRGPDRAAFSLVKFADFWMRCLKPKYPRDYREGTPVLERVAPHLQQEAMFAVATHLEKLYYRLGLQERGRDTSFVERMDTDFAPRLKHQRGKMIISDVNLSTTLSTPMRAPVRALVGEPLVDRYVPRSAKRGDARSALWLEPQEIEVAGGVLESS